jgi:hypothetical protein
VPPGVRRQRRTAERRWGKGPRHPWTARATCEWCQSTGCRRMATESRPRNHHGLPTGHRHCVCPCDHGRDRGCEPPEASSLSRSSRGQRGWSAGSRNPPGVGGGSLRCAVEGRGGSGGCSGGEAKLLEKQIVLSLRKGGKRLHAGEDGGHAIEASTQTTEEVEHEALIGHGSPEGAESVCHRLHLTAVLVHREIALNKLAEGGL